MQQRREPLQHGRAVVAGGLRQLRHVDRDDHLRLLRTSGLPGVVGDRAAHRGHHDLPGLVHLRPAACTAWCRAPAGTRAGRRARRHGRRDHVQPDQPPAGPRDHRRTPTRASSRRLRLRHGLWLRRTQRLPATWVPVQLGWPGWPEPAPARRLGRAGGTGLAGRSQPLPGDLRLSAGVRGRPGRPGLPACSQPLGGDPDRMAGVPAGRAARSQPLPGDLRRKGAVPAGRPARSQPFGGGLCFRTGAPAAGRARSHPLPGDVRCRGCGAAVPALCSAKFSFTARPLTCGGFAGENAAYVPDSEEGRPAESRSFGSWRAGGRAGGGVLPASRSAGTAPSAPADAARNAVATWANSGRGARSGAGRRSTSDTSQYANGHSSRS